MLKNDLGRITKQRDQVREVTKDLKERIAHGLDPHGTTPSERIFIDKMHAWSRTNPIPMSKFIAEAEDGMTKSAMLEHRADLKGQLAKIRARVDTNLELEGEIHCRLISRGKTWPPTPRSKWTKPLRST